MPELDPFERGLETALRAFADRGVIPVDAVEFTARVARRPRGMPSPWRPAPRLAWVLLLLAGLFAALVGGTLLVGSRPPQELPAVVPPVTESIAPPVAPAFACPPGSTPDQPGPVDQLRPPTLEISMAFDRAAGKVVALGFNGTWTFDVCTNTWTWMDRTSAPNFDMRNMLVYEAGARQTIYVAEDGVWAYDLASDTWTRRGDAPEIGALQGGVRLVYDPVGGRVIALELGAPGPTWSGRMWSYDAGPGTWQPVAQNEQLSAETDRQPLLAYDQSVDRLVSYSLDGEVRLFDLRTGTWSAPGAASPPFTYGTAMMNTFSFGGEIAYDEAAQRTVLFSNGAVIAYDAAADHWETLYRQGPYACPTCRSSPHMVYDPVNERLVVYGGAGGDAELDEVLAFDLRTREWTVLVQPNSARP
jgi:hypothetical protein